MAASAVLVGFAYARASFARQVSYGGFLRLASTHIQAHSIRCHPAIPLTNGNQHVMGIWYNNQMRTELNLRDGDGKKHENRERTQQESGQQTSRMSTPMCQDAKKDDWQEPQLMVIPLLSFVQSMHACGLVEDSRGV